MSGNPTVEFKDFTFAYPDETPLLEISRYIFRGPGVFSIKGPSGKGKSSLISLIAAHDQAAYGGSLRVLGQEWGKLAHGGDRSKQRHRRKIAFIPADYGLLDSPTVRQTLEQDLRDAGLRWKRERTSRIDTALKELEIHNLADRPIYKLSSGQRQRVAIARAMARRAQLIVADEPTANLDERLTQKVIDIFQREGGHALVLIASHDDSVLNRCKPIFDIEDVALSANEVSDEGEGDRRFVSWIAVRMLVVLLVVMAGFFVWQSIQRNGQPSEASVQGGAPPTAQDFLISTTTVNAVASTATMTPTMTSEGIYAVPTWTPLSLATEAPTWTPLSLESADDASIPTAPPDYPLGPNDANPGSTSPPIQPIGPEDVPTAET